MRRVVALLFVLIFKRTIIVDLAQFQFRRRSIACTNVLSSIIYTRNNNSWGVSSVQFCFLIVFLIFGFHFLRIVLQFSFVNAGHSLLKTRHVKPSWWNSYTLVRCHPADANKNGMYFLNFTYWGLKWWNYYIIVDVNIFLAYFLDMHLPT